MALTCSHSKIPQPEFDLADAQDGDVKVDCTVIFGRQATGSLSLLMGIVGSRSHVIESLCGARSIEVGGLAIDIDPDLVQGQIDQHLSALNRLGINTNCVPFLNEANGSLSGTLSNAVDGKACLGFRVRAEGPDFDWGAVGAPQGWDPIVVKNLGAGSLIIRFRRDWVVVRSYCHE